MWVSGDEEGEVTETSRVATPFTFRSPSKVHDQVKVNVKVNEYAEERAQISPLSGDVFQFEFLVEA